MYLAKSPKKLVNIDMYELSVGLNCHIKYVGKVNNKQRWDYLIDKDNLRKEDIGLVKEKGLKLLLTPEQRNKLVGLVGNLEVLAEFAVY